jgi:hypothetical protein
MKDYPYVRAARRFTHPDDRDRFAAYSLSKGRRQPVAHTFMVAARHASYPVLPA